MIDILIEEKVEQYYFETDKTPADIALLLGITEQKVLVCAKNFRSKLIKRKGDSFNNTPKRNWSQIEIEFLEEFQNELTVKEASLILRRPRYGTYLKVRQLGLRNMIE